MSGAESPQAQDALTLAWNSGLAGDTLAYEFALGELARILRGYLRSRLPLVKGLTEELTEDLVQDVLITVHTKRHTYRQDFPLLPWAYAITKHRLIDYLRMMKVRPKTLSLFEDEETWARIEGEASLRVENERLEKVAHQEVRDELLELIDELSPQQREVLRLAKLENRPLSEIAASLQMSLANVKVTVHRAVKNLKAAQQRKSHEDF
jgi:RNA polymerase sigma-70 factor, ECF subfamily